MSNFEQLEHVLTSNKSEVLTIKGKPCYYAVDVSDITNFLLSQLDKLDKKVDSLQKQINCAKLE